MALQHLRSSTANKRPLPAGMSDGQLAVNTNSTSPGIFFKTSTGVLIKAGPVHVGTTAPNASPAPGGETGNSTGELWLDTSLTPNELKTWDGTAWISATGQEIPVSKLIDGSARQLLQTDAAGTGVEWTSNVDVPGTLDVTGATTLDSTLTVIGDVTLNAQADLRFADSDSSNWVAFQAPATVSTNVTWTLPATDGTSGQALSTNGSGTLSWSAVGASLDTAQTWTKGQRSEVTALTDAATIAVDFSDSNNFSVTLGGNRTLGNPTNQVAGQSGSIFVTQDGTGSRTLAYASDWEFAGGTAFTLSTAASSVDRIDYIVRASGSIHAVLTKAFV